MQRITYCLACGIPLVKEEDFGGRDPNNKYCVHCTDEKGKLRTSYDVRNGIRKFWSSRDKGQTRHTDPWPDQVINPLYHWRR